MGISQSTPLLGGLSPVQFMRRHWQKKPLLVRGAMADFKPLLSRTELFELATRDDVESRLLRRDGGDWFLRHGPMPRRSLPPLKQAHWTLLVQGVDLQDDSVHALMQQFRFVPDARQDDLMISYASDGGGVGPHVDSYDVFLLQAQGQRRWRIGPQKDTSLVEGLPLRILANFEPEHEYLLERGDMLYLPPRWAHDGVAIGGDCMTYSIGFHQPSRRELAYHLLQRLADDADDPASAITYRDRQQVAVDTPAAIPDALVTFTREAIFRAVRDQRALTRVLGEWLTEPKSQVWFEAAEKGADPAGGHLVLDRRTRMMYHGQHIFINGESHRLTGRNARLLRGLADARTMKGRDYVKLGDDARQQVADWLQAGWLHVRA